MSLINDALRRAKQVQEQAPTPPPAPPLSPVEPAPYALHGVGVVVPVAMTAIALLGLFLLWQVYERNNSNRTAQPVAHAAPSPQARPAVEAQPQATTLAVRSAAPISSNPNAAAANALAPGAARTVGAPGQAVPPNPGSSADVAGMASITNVAPPSGAGLSTNAIAAQPEPPKPAPLTLQGIVFNPRRPSVVINGKTLFLGDRIGQFRVAAIHSDSATLVGAGRTNLLSLEQ